VISEKSELVWKRRPGLVGLRERMAMIGTSVLEQLDLVARCQGDDVPDAGDAEADASSLEPYGPGSYVALAGDVQPEGFAIKGNANSMLYHTPDSAFYDRTNAEVWFATEADAEAAGFSKPASQKDDD
jgi:large subunit ribosomal protein L17